MIPAIALIIAVYGTGRLLNDGFARHPNHTGSSVFTWTVSLAAIAGLWLLAFAVNVQGMGAASKF